MSAASYATGITQNTSTSGKDKKGEKFGDKNAKMRILTYAVIGIVVIVIVSIIAKIITSHAKKKKSLSFGRFPKRMPSLGGMREGVGERMSFPGGMGMGERMSSPGGMGMGERMSEMRMSPEMGM
jgi:hypothetical protein